MALRDFLFIEAKDIIADTSQRAKGFVGVSNNIEMCLFNPSFSNGDKKTIKEIETDTSRKYYWNIILRKVEIKNRKRYYEYFSYESLVDIMNVSPDFRIAGSGEDPKTHPSRIFIRDVSSETAAKIAEHIGIWKTTGVAGIMAEEKFVDTFNKVIEEIESAAYGNKEERRQNVLGELAGLLDIEEETADEVFSDSGRLSEYLRLAVRMCDLCGKKIVIEDVKK